MPMFKPNILRFSREISAQSVYYSYNGRYNTVVQEFTEPGSHVFHLVIIVNSRIDHILNR